MGYFSSENFCSQLKTSQNTWEIITEAYLPRTRGWDGKIGYVSIFSDTFGFCEHISTQNYVLKLKTSESEWKNIWGYPPPPQKGQRWCDGLNPDIKWFIRVSRISFIWKFFFETQNSQTTLDIIVGTYLPHTWVGVRRLCASWSWVIHANIFQLEMFYPNPKIRKVREEP